ncbi:19210_t:CDS:1, partial [Racocetra fulgida]
QPIEPSQPFAQLVEPSSASQPNHFHPTRLNVNLLNEENKMLREENELLKAQLALVTEELDVYKNPGTTTL